MPSDVKIRVWHLCFGPTWTVVYCHAEWPVSGGIGAQTDDITILEESLDMARELWSYMRDGPAKTFWDCLLRKKQFDNWWSIEYPRPVTMDELRNPIDLIGGWPDIEGELEWAEARRADGVLSVAGDNEYEVGALKLRWRQDPSVPKPVATLNVTGGKLVKTG